jgi:light-regulated signal transduction histidine kinase (bacteriophytochrome)
VTAIQPCALLLLVGPDWRIETISANVAMLGDHKPSELVGQQLTELIGSKAIHSLRNRMSWLSSDESEVHDFGVQWGDVMLDVRAVHGGNSYLIEAELAVEPRLPDGIGMVRSMSDRLSGDSPNALASQAMNQLAALTGFEQILLCDRNNKPIATNKNGNGASFIEAVNTARLIADCAAEPVPLIGAEEDSLSSRAAYVAPGAEQCAKLQSLCIAASMALPLRIDGEQVATIEAHHSTPRRNGAERRSVAHLFSERLVARMARQGWDF